MTYSDNMAYNTVVTKFALEADKDSRKRSTILYTDNPALTCSENVAYNAVGTKLAMETDRDSSKTASVLCYDNIAYSSMGSSYMATTEDEVGISRTVTYYNTNRARNINTDEHCHSNVYDEVDLQL